MSSRSGLRGECRETRREPQEGADLAIVGRVDEAITITGKSIELSEPRPSPHLLTVLAFAHSRAGDEAAARRVLDRLIDQYENEVGMAYAVARVYGFLGEIDSALEWYKRSIDDREWLSTWAPVDPLFDPIRNDPRLAPLLERLGLPDDWQ